MIPSIDKLLFVAASGFPAAQDRRAFLEFACRGDETRLKRLEELLEIQRDAEEFFELQPEVGATHIVAGDDDQNESGLGARIGPYRLIERLGSGGCGVVYLAEQQEPVKRKVALKIIRLGMDTESVITRFNMEREALAMMDHPNIARVLDAGSTVSGRPYFAMELVDGEKITEFCDRKKLGLRERLELFISVCEAIQHAHQKGVIHRDIKPSNVLVREHDGRAVVKVIDFGIAKATGGGFEGDVTSTRFGQFIGTPAYMSPEQAEGGMDVDTRSDIYSLGALLCELLTGAPPFEHGQFKDRGVDEIRGILRDKETASPSHLLRTKTVDELREIADMRTADPQRLPASLAGDLDWIVMKAIEKERQNRYETANGLAMDVRRYLDEEPVLARPPSRRYRLRKLVRRNRIVFTAGAIALFGLLAGLGVSTWLFISERDARHEQARLHDVAERARSNAERARANEVRLREQASAADLVTQAAVLVRYGDFAQADKLLGTLPENRVPRSLEAADTLKSVADWNLQQGRWKAAADRFNALVPVITSVDLTDTDRTSRLMMPAGAAIHEWGDAKQYDHFRELTIQRFGDSSDPGVAAQVIKAALLDPADEYTLQSLASLGRVLDKAVKSGKMESAYLLAWRQFSLALLAYRQGEMETATGMARLSLASREHTPSLTASLQILMAMVDIRQGRQEDALAKLKEPREAVKHWQATAFKLGANFDFWFDWENARILLKEADGMLGVSN